MSYVLGYIAADGYITISRERKNNPFSLNITSSDMNRYRIGTKKRLDKYF